MSDVRGILNNIGTSPELQAIWDKYRKQFAYAADIQYGQVMEALKTLMKEIGSERLP